MPPTLYRWKVLKDDSPWKLTGKILPYLMTEEAAATHAANNNRVLEKVPGSEWTPAPASHWSIEARPPQRLDKVVTSESEHFMRCPECGQEFDMRDLGQVAHHAELGHDPR